MDIKKIWDEAVTYNEYLTHAGEILGNPRNQQDIDYLEYYKLGIQRMNRMSEKYLPNEKQVETLAQKNFRGRILIISEAWCGDASQAIPVVVKFFEQYEVRITYRDQEPSLIDNFLTNGGKSIPIILFLDEDFNVIGQWGPRPAHGKELLNKHKNDPENYTKDDFYHELQVYYARNKGYDTIEELLEIIPSGK